jgi:hypothetical protein
MKYYYILLLIVYSLAIHSSETAATPCYPLPISSNDDNYLITDCRTVSPGPDTYTYKYVHVSGGTLQFIDSPGTINFNAKSILIEQGGSVTAGTYDKPFGTNGGKLNIGLYGAGPGPTAADIKINPNPAYPAINCKNNVCYPAEAIGKGCFKSVNFNPTDPCEATLPTDHSQDNSYFEGYADENPPFGYKVFAVSYGGSLELFGKKGVAVAYQTDPDIRTTACPVPTNAGQNNIDNWALKTGNSWVRAGSNSSGNTLTLDRSVDWTGGDQLIVGTTDWSTSHSELVSIASLDSTKKIGHPS